MEVAIGVVATILAAFLGAWYAHYLNTKKRSEKAKSRTATVSRSDGTTEPAPKPQDILNTLNPLYVGKVRLHRVLFREPMLLDIGIAAISKEEEKVAALIAEERRAARLHNDLTGVLSCDPALFDDVFTFSFHKIPFVTVLAKRKLGQKPRVLSANAVIFCDELKEVYLHRRSHLSSTYPSALHTIGGMFLAPDTNMAVAPPDDAMSLVNTAEREVREETNVHFVWAHGPMLVSTETDTGFEQLVLLGAKVSQSEVSRVKENWEGKVVPVSYHDLGSLLMRDDAKWVPSGHAHLLVWLALGAPGSQQRFWDGAEAPTTVFHNALKARLQQSENSDQMLRGSKRA